jgi:GNAT superfamily N-acetyltransferase
MDGASRSWTMGVFAMSYADVWMIRPTLEHLPTWGLPDGYRLRTYRAGDEAAWVALHVDADPYFTAKDAHFPQEFAVSHAALANRMFFVETVTTEEVVGSITAWWVNDWRGSGTWGQVHWVVVARAHQGRGLAKPMMAHTLKRLAGDHTRALLDTYTGRTWAVKVYLDCGFTPDPAGLANGDIRDAWIDLQKTLRHPDLQRVLEQPMS